MAPTTQVLAVTREACAVGQELLLARYLGDDEALAAFREREQDEVERLLRVCQRERKERGEIRKVHL